MNYNTRSDLAGKHALLSPSYHHWLNYDDQKLEARFHSFRASARGTDLHNLAHEAIRLRVKLSKAEKALATYVADAIRYEMVCEQLLYYSDNCYGHADTIVFRRKLLRIHDLKTGLLNASFKQLCIYAALFCLEYGVDPFDIGIELRIYQRDDVKIYFPTAEEISTIMDKIIYLDQRVEILKEATW